MALSYADVGEILKMIDTSSCEEVVLELDGIKLVVRKGGQGLSPAESAAIPDASLSYTDAPLKGREMPQTTPRIFARWVRMRAAVALCAMHWTVRRANWGTGLPTLNSW